MHEKTKIADIQTQSMLDHIGRKLDPFVLRRKVNIFSNDPKFQSIHLVEGQQFIQRTEGNNIQRKWEKMSSLLDNAVTNYLNNPLNPHNVRPNSFYKTKSHHT